MIGLIGCIVIGITYANLDIMFKIVIVAVLFGCIIGLIPALIKIFSR